MLSVDTNILVRYLVRDDPEQYEQAVACIQGALAAGEPIHITRTVTLELEWVLRSRYRFDKPTVVGTLRALLEARNVSFEAEGAVEYACYLYEQGTADFADALHLACCTAEQALPFLTFDEKAARLAGWPLRPDGIRKRALTVDCRRARAMDKQPSLHHGSSTERT